MSNKRMIKFALHVIAAAICFNLTVVSVMLAIFSFNYCQPVNGFGWLLVAALGFALTYVSFDRAAKAAPPHQSTAR